MDRSRLLASNGLLTWRGLFSEFYGISWIQGLHANFFLKKKWMVIRLFSPLFPAPKTWLHVPWRQESLSWWLVTLVWHLVTFYIPWFSRLQLLGPKSRIACGREALSDSGQVTAQNTTCPVQTVRCGTKSKSGSLFPAHISSRRSRNLNAWKRLSRRRQVEDIWLTLDCLLWPVTLVALFPALDNTVCTDSHAKIGKFSRACNILSSRSFWCLYCIICVCFCCQK